MAPTAKKKMSASLSICLLDCGELDSKTKKWVEGEKDLKAAYSNKIEYSEIVELDPRKWSNNKLQSALMDFVRYDLKILAVRAAQYKKEVDSNKADIKDVAKRADADLKKSAKQLVKKISTAVDELVADKGNNARGLKDGKAALAKLDAIEATKIFAEPATMAAKAMAILSKALDAAGDDGKATAKALTEAAKQMAAADKVFEDNAREAQAAVVLMRRLPKSIKDDAAPELRAFAAKVRGADGTLGAFEDAMEKFGKEMDAAVGATKAGKPDAKSAASLAKELANSSTETKKAVAVKKEMRPLKLEFAKVEKLLK